MNIKKITVTLTNEVRYYSKNLVMIKATVMDIFNVVSYSNGCMIFW